LLGLPAQGQQSADQGRQRQLATAGEGVGVLGMSSKAGEFGRGDSFGEADEKRLDK
jgi:hypothetical protein